MNRTLRKLNIRRNRLKRAERKESCEKVRAMIEREKEFGFVSRYDMTHAHNNDSNIKHQGAK